MSHKNIVVDVNIYLVAICLSFFFLFFLIDLYICLKSILEIELYFFFPFLFILLS